jgi:hypothetical protein
MPPHDTRPKAATVSDVLSGGFSDARYPSGELTWTHGEHIPTGYN